MDPGAKFWVQGPFGPEFKNCNFLTKPYNMGVYRLAWTPKFIFKIISTPGAKFWVQGPFGPKFKNCNFLTKPYNMGVFGLAWTPAFIFETIWTPGPNFGSKGPLAPNFKIAFFLQNLSIGVSMDLPGLQQSYLRQCGPQGQILGPRALWPQI